MTWPCEQTAQAEQGGVCNRISIHGFLPISFDLFDPALVHAGVREI
jgi:hypothetical protein